MFTMLAASKMNGGRDRLHELSGIPPLSFTAKGKPLTAWSITGNTVQDGTPTPENPVEVQAVGDRTGNLFDGTICIDNVILSQRGNLAPNNSYALSEYIPVEPNMSYIYHFYHNIAENRSTYSICEYDSNQNVIQPLTVQWITENRDYNISFTTQANTAYIRINWKKAPDDDLMLITGSTPLPYEPYGYKIPVVTSADGTEPITTPIYLPTPLYSGEMMRSDGTITRSDGTTETFTAPQIPTINGTTVIDVDTAVKPESMTIKYRR